MSDSHKARNGMRCKRWKDTMLESKCQKKAWSKRKRRTNRAERRTGRVQRKWSTNRHHGHPVARSE